MAGVLGPEVDPGRWRPMPGGGHPLQRGKTQFLLQGNSSVAADRAVAACYSSLRRTPAHLRYKIMFKIRLFRSDQDPRDGILMDAVSSDMDNLGMIAEIKLPEVKWLRRLLTSELLCQVEIELPFGRGRIDAKAAVAWAEAFHLGDPCILGLSFIQMDEPDRRRLTQFVRDSQTRFLRRPA